MKTGPTGGIAADCSDNPLKRHRAGPWMPRPTTSTEAIGVSNDPKKDVHLFTAGEVDALNGFPSLPCFPGDLRALQSWDIRDLSLQRARDVQGEGFHIPLMVAWKLFIFSNTVRRSVLEMLPRPMPVNRRLDADVFLKAYDDEPDSLAVEVASSCKVPGGPASANFDFQEVTTCSPKKRRVEHTKAELTEVEVRLDFDLSGNPKIIIGSDMIGTDRVPNHLRKD